MDLITLPALLCIQIHVEIHKSFRYLWRSLSIERYSLMIHVACQSFFCRFDVHRRCIDDHDDLRGTREMRDWGKEFPSVP